MQQSQHHLYAAGNQSAAAAYQHAAGYAGPTGMNMPTAAQYNHVVMMPVNHPGMPQPGTHPQPYPGYHGRDGTSVIYPGQPTGMMLPAQPMQQGQRSATVPQVTTTHYVVVVIDVKLVLTTLHSMQGGFCYRVRPSVCLSNA